MRLPSGELFPPPRICCEPAATKPLSRRCVQRIERRRAVQQTAAETVHAWNWMAGHTVAAPPGFESEAQASALGLALESASLVEPPTESRKAALSALLKSTAGYGAVDGIGDVATYEAGAVSLPDSAHDSPSLDALARGDASTYLSGFDSMLRPLSELAELDDSDGNVRPYMDPK